MGDIMVINEMMKCGVGIEVDIDIAIQVARSNLVVANGRNEQQKKVHPKYLMIRRGVF